MNRRKIISFVLALSLALVPVALVGCGSASGPAGSAAAPSPEEAIANAELSWCGYTMGIDYVTADQERMAGSEFSGMGIRVTFRYIDGGTGTGGFDGNKMFELIDSNPIVLRDASGAEYYYNDSLTDVTFTITGTFFAISDAMPRFGVIFDVPAGTEIGDYTLSVGDGNDLQLAEFITDEYAEYLAD